MDEKEQKWHDEVFPLLKEVHKKCVELGIDYEWKFGYFSLEKYCRKYDSSLEVDQKWKDQPILEKLYDIEDQNPNIVRCLDGSDE
jgi:hypothetical protein